MMNALIRRKKVAGLILTAVVLAVTAGCPMRFVADYDSAVVEEIFLISKKVDMFFGKILETSGENREYDNFKNTYIEIEADLRSLLRRNEVRAFNEPTIKQINIALELWQSDKAKHKEKNTVSDFIAKSHRKQFARVFVAMAQGEIAKDIKDK